MLSCSTDVWHNIIVKSCNASKKSYYASIVLSTLEISLFPETAEGKKNT